MRILLIKPRAHLRTVLGLQGFSLLEPLELGYIAASVPQHEVRILDLRLHAFPQRAFDRVLRKWRPHVLGVTGYTHESSAIKTLARRAKALCPHTTVVVGGHHATVAAEDLNLPEVDAIVRGEGCQPFSQLIQALEDHRSLAEIPGVWVPGSAFNATTLNQWPQFPDPAELPLPRRELWNPSDYWSVWVSEEMQPGARLFQTTAMVRTSWGCKMKCSFCIVPYLCGGRHMPRPVDSVIGELQSIQAEHIYFCDDENFIDESFARDLAQAIEDHGIRKRYFAWARATTVNRSPDLLQKWRDIGLDTAFIGFEFPTDQELKDARKGASVAANEKALHTLRQMGVAVHAAFMVTPDHDEARFQTLHDYVQSLPPTQCSITVCTPSPGTPDYQAIKPRIWVDRPHDLHDCMHPLTPTTLPLRRFSKLLARQALLGIQRTPPRIKRQRVFLPHLIRALWAERRYRRAFAHLYRDYPRQLW